MSSNGFIPFDFSPIYTQSSEILPVRHRLLVTNRLSVHIAKRVTEII